MLLLFGMAFSSRMRLEKIKSQLKVNGLNLMEHREPGIWSAIVCNLNVIKTELRHNINLTRNAYFTYFCITFLHF